MAGKKSLSRKKLLCEFPQGRLWKKNKNREKQEPHLSRDSNLTMASSIEGMLFLKVDHCGDGKLIPEFSPNPVYM